MKPHRVVNRIVVVLLAVAAVKLTQGQRALDAAFRDHLARQARLESALQRLHGEAVLARQHHDELSSRMDRIEARH